MASRLVRVARGAALALAAISVLEVVLILVDVRHPPADNPLRIELPEGRTAEGLLHERSVTQLWLPRPLALVPWGGDRINARGWRGPEIPLEKRPGVLRIAALGDSSTFGHSVKYEECWLAQLEALLRADGVECEVIDAGVVGFTARQGLERWRELVRPYRPDIVVAAFGAVNEHVPAMGQPDDALIRESVLARSDFVLWTRRLRSDLRLAHLAAWWIDAFRGRVAAPADPERERLAHDWRASVVGRVDWPGLRRVSPAEFAGCLRTLRAEVEDGGGRLVLLSTPRRGVVERDFPAVELYTNVLEHMAQAEHVPLADGRLAFGLAVRQGLTADDLFADRFHPTARGHALLAETVRDALPPRAPAERR